MEFRRRRDLKRTKIEIIPMIDTMFFLLVFFMLSSIALTRMRGIPVNLPKASTAQKQNTANLTITVNKDRQVFVDKNAVSIDDLGSALVSEAGGASVDMSKVAVIINADLTVPHGLVVQCIDDARSVGIEHFAIATSPTASSGGA